MNDDDLLRPSEARRLLNVGRTWLWERTKDGTVPSVRIGGPGGPLRYSRQALQRILSPGGESEAGQ